MIIKAELYYHVTSYETGFRISSGITDNKMRNKIDGNYKIGGTPTSYKRGNAFKTEIDKRFNIPPNSFSQRRTKNGGHFGCPSLIQTMTRGIVCPVLACSFLSRSEFNSLDLIHNCLGKVYKNKQSVPVFSELEKINGLCGK